MKYNVHMDESIGLNIKGIKCDTPHCNYRDEDVPFEDYSNWVNKPCPVCGRSLLTLQDYNAVLKIVRVYYKMLLFMSKHRILGKILEWFLRGKSKTRIELHGEGFKTVTVSEVKE